PRDTLQAGRVRGVGERGQRERGDPDAAEEVGAPRAAQVVHELDGERDARRTGPHGRPASGRTGRITRRNRPNPAPARTPAPRLARMSSPAPEPSARDASHVGAVVEVGSLASRGRPEPRPQTGALEALLAPRDRDEEGTVRVVDTAEPRVRHPVDLVNLVLCAAGVVVVLLMSVYAHGTTAGVAEDVRNFSDLLARILFLPVQVLE